MARKRTKSKTANKNDTGNLLLVDIGNSRVKWAQAEDGELTHHADAPRPSATEMEVWADEHWGAYPPPRAAIIANVAGADLAHALETWCVESWHITPRFISAAAHGHGVHNAYAEPQRLGVDRWAALIAARARQSGAVCIIDCGTAITVDVLAADGRHQGGLIIPGLGLMRRALLEQTAGIRSNDSATPSGDVLLLARDTQNAVQGGTLYAAVATIDRMLADLRAELGPSLTCLITGGDAPTLLPLLSGVCHHVPDLVLRGLALLTEDT